MVRERYKMILGSFEEGQFENRQNGTSQGLSSPVPQELPTTPFGRVDSGWGKTEKRRSFLGIGR